MDAFRCSRCHEVKPADAFYWAKGVRGYQCKECHKKRNAEYKARHPERRRPIQQRGDRRYRYGITQERYDELVELQDGKCVVCELERPLQVDHNHASGEVRFLLCGKCNRAEGLLDGDPERAERLARYLRVTHPA